MESTTGGKFSNRIDVVKINITEMDVDAIVNAANDGLREGGGVCGAVFKAAGPADMRAACEKIGHCDTGDAVITPGFALKARYVIHAVGPIWNGGANGEAELLASCYTRSLDLAQANGCESIAFPLISSGIYGYPKREAWEVALAACSEWLDEHDALGEIGELGEHDGHDELGERDGHGGHDELRSMVGSRNTDESPVGSLNTGSSANMSITFCVKSEDSFQLAKSMLGK